MPTPKPSENTPAKDQRPSLRDACAKRGIDEATWRTLCNSVFPGALNDSILLAVDYCKARGLDVLKKPCHIVPMFVTEKRRDDKGAIAETKVWRDVILPGIYEYRVTAHRTGEYLGHSKPEYGPEIDFQGVKAPEYCALTVYRWNRATGERAEYPVEVRFDEVVATKSDGKPNARWSRAPRQMLTKCTEAAGLREAFPDEIGGEPTAEELDGKELIEGRAPALLGKPATEAPRAIATAEGKAPTATVDQVTMLTDALNEAKIDVAECCDQFGVPDLASIPFDDVPTVIVWIAGNHAP